jgi:hypothetical protein
MLVPLVEKFYAEPTASLHAEIRLTEARLGATVADRMGLRWRIGSRGDVPAGEPAEPTGRDRRMPRPDRGDPRLRVIPPAS